MAEKMAESNSEQFSLRWNNFHSNLSTGFHALLRGEDLVDVTLAAGGQFVQAHKLVLSVCSPYLKSLFKANPCKHPIVILKDVGHKELVHILEFMYRGEVNVRQDDLTDFLKTAEMLQVKGLAGDDTPANSCATQEPGKQSHSSPEAVKTEEAPARPAKRARTSNPLPSQPAPSVSPRPVQAASPALSVASSLTNDSPRQLDFIDLAKTKDEPVDYDSDTEKVDEHPSVVHNRVESFASNMHKEEEISTSFVSNFHKNEDSFMHLLSSGDSSQHHDSSLDPPGMFRSLPPMTGALAHDSGGSSQDGGQDSRAEGWERSRGQFKCPCCAKRYRWKTALQRHTRNEHGNDRGPFYCKACSGCYKNRRGLLEHQCKYFGQQNRASV
ncbi:protein tramtrack, beta isoform-like isoform X7 [Bacillus rossius redtenbacheri]|uniref:protein tramtrack, beta isoform-like isoform X7 n=1 Tax=Bacillus rossius redtenbacheri TaxID=93214 RepID=UPI002FDE8F64